MEPTLLFLMVLVFSVIVFLLGRRTQKIKSLAKVIVDFENSSKKNWFDAWFIGLSVPGQKPLLKNLVKTPESDKFVSLFFRLAGWFFIIFGVLGILSSPIFFFIF